MGWGWSHTFRPGPKTVDEIVATVQDLFKVEGFLENKRDAEHPETGEGAQRPPLCLQTQFGEERQG